MPARLPEEADLPLGWRTDLAVLRLKGAQVSGHGDHLVVRSPDNPGYFWGNFVLVTDAARADRPEHWLAVFEAAFPGTPHRAIGLPARPAAPEEWLANLLFVQDADVLVASSVPVPPLPAPYEVRRLGTGEDWQRSTRLRQASFPEQDAYEEATTRARIAASEGIAWFGAFDGAELVAELGIADCGEGTWRYQSVLTHQDHRGRGLVRHLLGVAAAHAGERGARRLVILADAGSAASRIYRAAGFAHEGTSYQVTRVPQPPGD